jgi:hypothetical protein
VERISGAWPDMLEYRHLHVRVIEEFVDTIAFLLAIWVGVARILFHDGLHLLNHGQRGVVATEVEFAEQFEVRVVGVA